MILNIPLSIVYDYKFVNKSYPIDVPDNTDPLHGRVDPQGHVEQGDAPDRGGGHGRQVPVRVGLRPARAGALLGRRLLGAPRRPRLFRH